MGADLRLGAQAAAVFVLIGLVGAAFALGGAADGLLTPLPGRWMGVTMASAIVLAFALALALASAVPWRLGQRLAVVVVMALTLYLCGQSSRGLYALTAFAGDVEQKSAVFLITGVNPGSVSAVDLARRGRVHALPADDDVALGMAIGLCATVAVDRASTGAERLASGRGVLTKADVGSCW